MIWKTVGTSSCRKNGLTRILVSRSVSADEAAVTFYIRGGHGQSPVPFLRITAITGTSRESKAVRGGRFVLVRKAETIYAAELLEANDSWSYGHDGGRGSGRV